jgi:Fur family ferric uptake transcriptional regulator
MKNARHLERTERANFRALVAADQVDRIPDRLNIIDTFLDTEEHITLEEFYRLLKEKGYDYEPSFVRQCMERMVDLGFAHKTKFEDQPYRYEHRHLGRHHDHLVCAKCGKIVEFTNEDLESLQSKIAAEKGFHMLQHRMDIYGLCSECLAQRTPLLPLAMAKEGERVLIKGIAGGVAARSTLASMGLREGDHVEIINNNGQGRLIVAVDCTRLALGRGFAQKIMVSLSDKKGSDAICDEPS